MFAEWAADSPLWTDGNRDLLAGVSETLTARLTAWNRRWEELASDRDHDDDASWSSWPPALEWNAEGYRLARMVREQLPDTAQLIYYDCVTDLDVVIEHDDGTE